MTKFFDPAFADGGNKTAVPDPTQVGGTVSYTEGYGPDYELDQVTEPSAKDIERQKMNQLFFDVTSLLAEIQRNGLPIYDALYNYEIGAYTLASNGFLYQALLVNGPATTVRNPINDVTGTWRSSRSDIRDWVNAFDYEPDDLVKASDGDTYRAITANGPASTIHDPIAIEATPFWEPLPADIRKWNSSTEYYGTTFRSDYVKGANGILYVALENSGPAAGVGVVNPDSPGANNDVWEVVGSQPDAMRTIIFTSNGTYTPANYVKSFRAIVTGGGGGGGGIKFVSTVSMIAGAGGSGGTAIKTFNRGGSPFSASYAVVVGVGGAGGLGAVPEAGGTGGNSSFDAGAVSGGGGEGGLGTQSTGGDLYLLGALPGSAGGGDVDIDGGPGGAAIRVSALVTMVSQNQGSYWGPGPQAAVNGAGFAAVNFGTGGSGAADSIITADRNGGAGAGGVVVIEEFF